MSRYITQDDIQAALGPNTMVALFDDNNTGSPLPASVFAVLARAEARVDSWLAASYSGPFPITQHPIPALITELALEYAIAFSFERNLDYMRAFNQKLSVEERIQRADQMGTRLQDAILRLPDYTAEPSPANVGGVVTDTNPILMVDANDNHGDF